MGQGSNGEQSPTTASGMTEAEKLFDQNLREEKKTDQLLTSWRRLA